MHHYIGIDISTKTGFVVLDKQGTVVQADLLKLSHAYPSDAERFVHLRNMVMEQLETYQLETNQVTIVIEGFGFVSQKAVFQGGIGWLIRCSLWEKGYSYYEASPNQLKKFSGANGQAKKQHVMLATYKEWGFENHDDNITDAFVLAKMAYHLANPAMETKKYQKEVLDKVKGVVTHGKTTSSHEK